MVINSSTAALGAAVGTTVTMALVGTDFVLFGYPIPVAGLVFAMAGALLPQLFIKEEALWPAFKSWLGGVIVSCIATPMVMLAFSLNNGWTVALSGFTAALGRELFMKARGSTPPILSRVGEMWADTKGGGKGPTCKSPTPSPLLPSARGPSGASSRPRRAGNGA
jgi:hypothetical protein